MSIFSPSDEDGQEETAQPFACWTRGEGAPLAARAQGSGQGVLGVRRGRRVQGL